MKRSSIAVLSLLALAACSDEVRTPAGPDAGTPSRGLGKYIVVLKDDGGLKPSFSRSAVTQVADEARVIPERVFSNVLAGFSAELTDAQVAALRADPSVAYVEVDAPVRLSLAGVQTTLYSWGLDRVDQRALPLSNTFGWSSDGAGVNAYILDTGINPQHLDFVNKTAGTVAFVPNGKNGDFVNDGHGSAQDCQGHGSHVAGTVGGFYSGVAKAANIWGARVVNCSGGGNASMVIAAMDWVAANGRKPGVVNMSLGYGNVVSVRDAAERLVAAGFTVAAAAGNGNFAGTPINACNESPANAPNVLTVGATSKTDAEASFSNYGTCVDLLAPGVDIMSADYAVINQVTALSGTSMASPHVAGVAALYLGSNPTATPATVMTALKNNTTAGVVVLHRTSKRYGTPNKLLFSNY